ncbi:LysE family transporter [Candidatus Latescibacterota bacterium]
MSFTFFLIQAVIISLTGVMSPGPMTAAAVGTGTRSPHTGAMIAVGHGIIEFPLMALVYYGLGHFLSISYVKATIFALGGLFLLFMGVGMLINLQSPGELSKSRTKAPIVVGMLFSLGNVYFLIWWVTVGTALISKAVEFGIAGVMIFALVHWLCDFVWFYFLSTASYKGGRVFGAVFQKSVFGVSGVFLILFGGLFMFDAIRQLLL